MLKSIEIHDIPRHSTTSSASSYQPSSHSLAATKNLHRRTWEAQEMNLTGSGMMAAVCSIGTLIWNLVCSFVFRHGYHHRLFSCFGAQRPPMFDLFAGDPKITVSLWQVAKRFKGKDDCWLVQCMPRISTFRIPATARQLKNHFGTAEQSASVQKSAANYNPIMSYICMSPRRWIMIQISKHLQINFLRVQKLTWTPHLLEEIHGNSKGIFGPLLDCHSS